LAENEYNIKTYVILFCIVNCKQESLCFYYPRMSRSYKVILFGAREKLQLKSATSSLDAAKSYTLHLKCTSGVVDLNEYRNAHTHVEFEDSGFKH